MLVFIPVELCRTILMNWILSFGRGLFFFVPQNRCCCEVRWRRIDFSCFLVIFDEHVSLFPGIKLFINWATKIDDRGSSFWPTGYNSCLLPFAMAWNSTLTFLRPILEIFELIQVDSEGRVKWEGKIYFQVFILLSHFIFWTAKERVQIVHSYFWKLFITVNWLSRPASLLLYSRQIPFILLRSLTPWFFFHALVFSLNFIP